jgi:hypothetical protein
VTADSNATKSDSCPSSAAPLCFSSHFMNARSLLSSTALRASFGLPAGTTGRVAIPVAGDDPKAKAIVFRLVDDIGFDSVDAGSLAESWRQQPGTPVYGPDFVSAEVQRALSQASRERPAEFRAEESKGTSA